MMYELRIALRYLRARRKQGFISVTTLFTALGVMIGVAALVVMLSVMAGFQADLRQRLLALTPQVEVQSTLGSIDNYALVQSAARRIKGVAGSDLFVIGQGLASSSHGVSAAVVRGIEPDNPAVTVQIGRYVTHGSLSSLAAPAARSPGGAQNHPVASVMIGSAMAAKLGVKVGDSVKLLAPIIDKGRLSTRTGAFVVSATFESGVAFIDQNLVFMNLPQAQAFFGRGAKVDGIDVRLKSLDYTRQVTDQLRAELPRTFRVSNWIEFNQAASAGFAMLKLVYSLVLMLLIGVAAFNLIATLIMVVMEKRKDIAVLMAMGATRRDVRRIFVFKGLIVGAAGTLAGLLLGAGLCFSLARYHFIHIPKQIYGISTLPVKASPLSFLLVAVASIVLCLLATIYPARQASRELPAEILRS